VSVTRLLLRATGLPSLQPVAVDDATEAELEAIADRFEAGDASAIADAPLPRIEFLRWLADRRDVLFHGSSRDDLGVLEPIRLSTDVTEFGNQQAVYATSDPVWAIYFAILRRHAPFGTRNGTMGLTDAVYPRWYFFTVRRPFDRLGRFGPGSLYVLPRRSFVEQAPLYGSLRSAQWVSRSAVRPLVRIEVTPDDFPFLDVIGSHREREPILFSVSRTAAKHRLSRLRQ
jgi:hypothetical protein